MMDDTSLLPLTRLPPLTHSLGATSTAHYGWVMSSSISSFYTKLPNSCQVIAVGHGFNSRITGRRVTRRRGLLKRTQDLCVAVLPTMGARLFFIANEGTLWIEIPIVRKTKCFSLMEGGPSKTKSTLSQKQWGSLCPVWDAQSRKQLNTWSNK